MHRVARAATLKALHSTHMQELAPHHWCCYVDAHGINPDGTTLSLVKFLQSVTGCEVLACCVVEIFNVAF
jgi:hypothetical protein